MAGKLATGRRRLLPVRAMKLYVFAFAPNPRKVLCYIKEKGLALELVNVNIAAGEQKRPEFLAKNPLGALPVLELDDGTALTESLAIIEYLEEKNPQPPMIGTSPVERARVRELERIIEMSILGRAARVFRNTHPMFASAHIPQVAEQARAELPPVLDILDKRIGGNAFVAGERPTIADCTLFATFGLAQLAELDLVGGRANIGRWHESFQRRPSAQINV
jgi:glutathione S-transferase